MPTDMTCRPFHTPDNKIEERGKDRGHDRDNYEVRHEITKPNYVTSLTLDVSTVGRGNSTH